MFKQRLVAVYEAGETTYLDFLLTSQSLTDFISDRTRILASISHDLKTPLTSMMLRAEFLEDSEDKENDEENAEGEGDEDFDFDNLGDIFGAEDEE